MSLLSTVAMIAGSFGIGAAAAGLFLLGPAILSDEPQFRRTTIAAFVGGTLLTAVSIAVY